MSENKILVQCCCGGEDRYPHVLGEGDCYREIVSEELSPIPYSSAEFNHCFWSMPGPSEDIITDYTLRQQRMYFYHEEKKCWSRPKDHDSTNSISA